MSINNIENEVRDDVTRLLAMLNPQVSEDSLNYQFVRDRLTQMSIRGTLPAGSRPLREGLIPGSTTGLHGEDGY